MKKLKAIHVLNHRDGLSFQDLNLVDPAARHYKTEAWPGVELDEVELEVTKVYGHTRKGAASSYGGTIIAAEESKTYPGCGLAFVFRQDPDGGRGKKWRGAERHGVGQRCWVAVED